MAVYYLKAALDPLPTDTELAELAELEVALNAVEPVAPVFSQGSSTLWAETVGTFARAVFSVSAQRDREDTWRQRSARLTAQTLATARKRPLDGETLSPVMKQVVTASAAPPTAPREDWQKVPYNGFKRGVAPDSWTKLFDTLIVRDAVSCTLH